MSREAAEAAKFQKMLAVHGLRSSNPLDDFFHGTAATDIFNGGTGRDTVLYHKSTAGINISLAEVDYPRIGGFAEGDRFFGIENAVGSDHDDRLEGNFGANTLVGLDGNDRIGGGAGDRLYGDDGNDTLTGSVHGAGSIYMNGGADADTIRFGTSRGGTAEIVTGEGADRIEITLYDRAETTVVIKDFQPFFKAGGSIVSQTEAMRGDFLVVRVPERDGETAASMKEFHTEIRGNDMIWIYDDPRVNLKIVMEDLGNHLDLSNYSFSTGFDTFPLHFDAV